MSVTMGVMLVMFVVAMMMVVFEHGDHLTVMPLGSGWQLRKGDNCLVAV
jgi:hypothetical protein